MERETQPSEPGFAPDRVDVIAVRSCGCEVWHFRLDTFAGLAPMPEDDPLEWLQTAMDLGGRRIRRLEAPSRNLSGMRGFPGARGPSGRRHLPTAAVVEGELVLIGRNLCPHARHENAGFKGRELHRWATFEPQIRAAIEEGLDPRWPVVVRL